MADYTCVIELIEKYGCVPEKRFLQEREPEIYKRLDVGKGFDANVDNIARRCYGFPIRDNKTIDDAIMRAKKNNQSVDEVTETLFAKVCTTTAESTETTTWIKLNYVIEKRAQYLNSVKGTTPF